MEKHSNINNQFIPYEQALELKGLGFKNNWNFKEYDTMGYLQHTGLLDSHKLEAIDAALWQQAFDWFREKGFRFNIQSHRYTSVEFFMVELYDGKRRTELFGKSLTYEEARLECLKKLIEIIKNESK